MIVHPTFANVLIKPEIKEQKTAGGIYLADGQSLDDSAILRGKVVEVGPRVVDIKKGDMVMLKKWGAQEYKDDKIAYQIVPEEDIIAVIKE